MPNAEEIRQRMREKLKGRSAWNKGKIGAVKNPLKGKRMPEDWADKARAGRAGKVGGWQKGKTSECDDRILSGDKHYAWKGDDVGLVSLHKWVYRKLGSPMICEFCGKQCMNNHQIHWANKSGEYKRDLKDWLRLCVSCHKKYDLNK